MILSKIFFISAAVLPFFHKSPIRGDRAYETRLPPPLAPESVEANGHPTPMASPRKPLVPVSHLTLVHDASTQPVMDENDASDVSEIRAARVIEFDNRKVASTRKFVKWLREFHANDAMSLTRLLGRYYEYCEFENVRPVKERQLLNCIGEYGVEKDRPTAKMVDGKSHRPTIYTARPVIRRVA